MKITFEEVLSRNLWLHNELMNSLTGEIIEKTKEDRFYDVKLLVNGVELEPVFYNKLVNNIEKYIEDEAKHLVCEKLAEAENKLNQLIDLINTAKGSIIDGFGLVEEKY